MNCNKPKQWSRKIENHKKNTETMEAVTFVKCRDFAKMQCFAVFLAKML